MTVSFIEAWRGYGGLKTPLGVPKSFFGETLMGEGVALRGLRGRVAEVPSK